MRPSTFLLVVISLLSFLAGIGLRWTYTNWYRLSSGYTWDTLRIRCEDERKGVLVGETCFRADAVIWPADEAPK